MLGVHLLNENDVDILLLAGRVVPLAATRIYEMSFFTGFGVSALVYWSLNFAFPAAGKSSSSFEEVDLSAGESEHVSSSGRSSPVSDKKEEMIHVSEA